MFLCVDWWLEQRRLWRFKLPIQNSLSLLHDIKKVLYANFWKRLKDGPGLQRSQNWGFIELSLNFLEHKNSWIIGESSVNVKNKKVFLFENFHYCWKLLINKFFTASESATLRTYLFQVYGLWFCAATYNYWHWHFTHCNNLKIKRTIAFTWYT